SVFERSRPRAVQTARQTETATAFACEKNPEAVSQVQPTLPTVFTTHCENHTSGDTFKVLAQDEPRQGLLPVGQRRLTACGVHPVATIMHHFENFYLSGAVEPTTGVHVLLELPYLNSRAFQCWLDGFAAAFPESMHMLVLDNGAGHNAKAVRW